MSDGLDPILQQKEQHQLKTQLLWRLGIAGTLIAVVLGAIAWLDQEKNNKPPEVQIPQFAPTASAISEIARPEPITEEAISEPVTTATPASAPTTESTPIPTVVPASTTPLPTTPKQSVKNAPNQTPIETINNIPKRPVELAMVKTPRATPLVTATSKPADSPQTAIQPNLKFNNPQANLASAPPTNSPAANNTQLGYSVQAGVFLHSNNAEKLLAQIQAAGIPAYLETRVQIGPFKNKADADAAVKKLRTLGIDPIVKTQ